MKRYALLDTDFISKTHSVQDDGGNHLIDRVIELPEYEFFCHAQIVTELNRYQTQMSALFTTTAQIVGGLYGLTLTASSRCWACENSFYI